MEPSTPRAMAATPRSADPVERTCPDCGHRVTTDPRFSAWCEACDWNVDPRPASPPSTRIGRWMQARSDRAARATHEQVMAHGPTARPLHWWLATLSAVPVHAVTLIALIAGLRLAVSHQPLVFRIIGAPLLFGIVWEVFPRLGRMHQGPGLLTEADAPATYAVLRRVAAEVGARCPDVVAVEALDNASQARIGWRRRSLLVIGLPLWNTLDAPQKLALLGHELGHEVNHDSRRNLLVDTALRSLRRWALLLLPGPGRSIAWGNSLLMIAEWVTRPIQYLVFWIVWAAGSAVESLADRGGQRAEYRADLIAVRLAGREATASMLEQLDLSEHRMRSLTAAVNRQDRDIWATQRTELATLPRAEVIRASRAAELRLQRVDQTHPPTHWRIDLVRAQPSTRPAVSLEPDLLARMDAELLRWMRADRIEVGVRPRPLDGPVDTVERLPATDASDAAERVG